MAFNGADAKKYANFIVAKEQVAAPVVSPVVEEVKEEKPKRKYVRKGRK